MGDRQSRPVIWSGVYSDFASAGYASQSHTTEQWIEKSLHRLEIVESDVVAQTTDVFSSNPLLVLGPLLDLVGSREELNAVDYGGNMGQLGIWVQKFAGLDRLNWTVTERMDFLENSLVRQRLPQAIKFCSHLADVRDGVGLLHFGSSVQYVEDLGTEIGPFLQRVVPKWVTVADFMGSQNIDDFVTRQRYYDSFIVSKFRNLHGFVDFFGAYGYQLVYSAGSMNEKNMAYYPEGDLPSQNQILTPLDLIFRAE